RDWSSDVCSSDLAERTPRRQSAPIAFVARTLDRAEAVDRVALEMCTREHGFPPVDGLQRQCQAARPVLRVGEAVVVDGQPLQWATGEVEAVRVGMLVDDPQCRIEASAVIEAGAAAQVERQVAVAIGFGPVGCRAEAIGFAVDAAG